MKLMPSSNARFTQATALSRSTPTPYVSQEPSEISETFKSLAPSLRYFMASSTVLLQDRKSLPSLSNAQPREAHHDHEQAMDLCPQTQRAGGPGQLRSPRSRDAAGGQRRGPGAHDTALARSGEPRLDAGPDVSLDAQSRRRDGGLGHRRSGHVERQRF